MSTSKESVINEALVRIGANPIASLSDGNAQAIAANEVFDTIYRDAISMHPWSFAIRSRQLSQVSVADQDRKWEEGKYVYNVPPKAVRILGLESQDEYQLAGDEIYTDAQTPILYYIEDSPVSAWPDYFRLYVVLKFAAAVAVAITDSNSRGQRFDSEARFQARQAMSLDSQQVPQKVFDLMRIYTRMRMNPLAGA